MTKSELMEAVAEQAGLNKKDSEKAVNATLNAIVAALKAEDRVSLVGFGSFEVRHRPARTGRDPRTGREITIAASAAPAFKAGKAFREAVRS